MSWYVLRIPLDQKETAKEIFSKSYKRAGAPIGASLFMYEFFIKEEYLYYLPPLAIQFSEELIKRYAGEPCDPPSPDGLLLMSGNKADWAIFS